MKPFEAALTGTATAKVTTQSTAMAVKSGSLEVYATPAMLALMEEATCNAVAPLLDDGEATVGTKISITHDKASALGEVITAQATLISVDGRRLTFAVSATDEDGNTIGRGEIERFAINEKRFMERVSSK